MNYGIKPEKGEFIEFIGEMTLSIGDGLDLDTRFGYDASKKPQSLTRRRLNTAKTASLNVTLTRFAAADLFKELEKYEQAAGVVGELFWDGLDLGLWCVKDVSFSLAVDAVDVISALQISINLCEGYVARKAKKVDIKLM